LNSEVQSIVQQSTSGHKNLPKASERDRGAPLSSKQSDNNIEGTASASGESLAEEIEFKKLSSAYQEATRNLYAQQEAARNLHIQEEKLRQLRQKADQQIGLTDQTVLEDQLVQQPHSGVSQSKEANVPQAQPALQIIPEQKRFPID
jgi:hypothetical protein